MSSVRLCLAGLLVAGGLILCAFTLHGYFDPQWEQKQGRAADPRGRPGGSHTIQALSGRNRFLARDDQLRPGAKSAPLGASAPAAAKPPAKVVGTISSTKLPPGKKVVDKAKKPPPSQQQASFQWPWNLFSN